MKIKHLLLASGIALLSACAADGGAGAAGNIFNRHIQAPLYTHSSGGQTAYRGKTQDVMGFLDRRPIGKIGQIRTDGTLELTLPESLPDDVLTTADSPNMIASDRGKIVFIEDPNRGKRVIDSGSSGRGGTLTTEPALTLWKNDGEILVSVYVNEDYHSSDMGAFHKGWNYARNTDHRAATSSEGYRWVLIDDVK